jgi:nicotinamidase-related amidase
MKIKIPASGRRRALLTIDAQTNTLRAATAHDVLKRIASVIGSIGYDVFVTATYSAPESSMFYRQSRWALSAEDAGPTDCSIERAIAATRKTQIAVAKTVRSVFRSERAGEVQDVLEARSIEEIHLVGFDINDCVLATAYEALDRGYFTYVIEECCGRADGNEEIIEAALVVLRKQNMTNRSSLDATIECDV